jgi:solute carrier family 35 protein F5
MERQLSVRITYLNTASFALYLIPSAIKYRRLGRFGSPSQAGDAFGYSALSTAEDAIDRPSSPVAPAVGRSPRSMTHALPHTYPQPHHGRDRSLSHTALTRERAISMSLDIPRRMDEEGAVIEGASGMKSPKEQLPKLTIRETARVAAWWAAAWFLANWTVNASLALTSVASVSILSSTSGELPCFFNIAYSPHGRQRGAGQCTGKIRAGRLS